MSHECHRMSFIGCSSISNNCILQFQKASRFVALRNDLMIWRHWAETSCTPTPFLNGLAVWLGFELLHKLLNFLQPMALHPRLKKDEKGALTRQRISNSWNRKSLQVSSGCYNCCSYQILVPRSTGQKITVTVHIFALTSPKKVCHNSFTQKASPEGNSVTMDFPVRQKLCGSTLLFLAADDRRWSQPPACTCALE